MNEKISLLERMGAARLDFQAANIKKTGKNKFVGFDYYELCDILPKINELSKTYRFFGCVTFNAETASLKIIDIDDQNQFVEFTSPMAGVNLKGAHEIQNMGAVQTYMRRYLYMMAFEIVECDELDGALGGKKDIAGNESKHPQSDTKTPQSGGEVTEQEKMKILLSEIGVIMKSVNPDQLPFFNNDELSAEREICKKIKTSAVLQSRLNFVKSQLEHRKNEFTPVPFEDDALPEPKAKKALEIF